MADMIKKNLAIIINIITLLCALSFGYGLLNKEIENNRERSYKNEQCMTMMREETHRDVKLILEKISRIEGYIQAKKEKE